MAGGQSVHILLMKDDAGQAQLAQRTLVRAGYTVEVVGNGATGLVLAATGAYDVLLVDYHMPGTGGLEVLQTLAAGGTFPPTIMVTGHGDEAVTVEAMKLGASDYLVKDVEVQYLTLLPTVVARVLCQHHLLEEKRQAEEALQQHLEWLDTTLTSIDDAVLTTDPAGTITFLNPVAAHLTGWSILEACGQPPPADLTRMTQRQDGLFPVAEITALIDGRTVIPAHGSREMPIWGVRFGEMGGGGPSGEAMVRDVLRRLIDYLQAIQQ